MSYAHKNNIVHRDIRPNNIIIYEDHIVLIDWGHSSFIDDKTLNVPINPYFTSSRILKKLKISETSNSIKYLPKDDIESLAYIIEYMNKGK